MKGNRKRKIYSLLVVGLLILSVMTAATAVVSAGQNNTVKPNTEEQNDTVKPNTGEQNTLQKFENIDFTKEELQKRVKEVKKKLEKKGPSEKKLDVISQKKLDLLKGISNPTNIKNKINTDPSTKAQHNVDKVHDMGIKGDNVKVSFMDTGFDMAQPDLRGKHAVFHYKTGMPNYTKQYDGYPIAYDATSMADYVWDGKTSEVSWYVNTSYETTAWDTSNMGVIAQYTEKTPEKSIYKLPATVSDGDKVRFGLHPDDKLLSWYGEKPAILLTQNDDGDWANVYVDLDNDRSFRDENVASIDVTDRDSECISQDITGDGIADISGGMVYFISNENSTGQNMPIPYSQNFRDTMNKMLNLLSGYPPGTFKAIMGMDAWSAYGFPEPQTTPEPGDLVALMGDFNSPGAYGAHGTWTATAVAGQGVTGVPNSMMKTDDPSPHPPDPEGGDGLIQGMAPNVDIIPMGHFFDYPTNGLASYNVPYSSIFFAAEGYDANTATHSDQAQIASSSFGNSNPVNVGGFNYYDRLMDWVGSQYTWNTLFVNSEGNAGSGFGTEGAPAGGQGILSVGASSNQYYRVDGWNEYDKGPNPWYGEATGMSSRGPDAIGAHGPDIMTNGQYGYGGDPLNNHAFDVGHFQGNNSWVLWSGTSLASPNAAGISALVYQAYYEETGMRPTNEMVKSLVMQGADDMKNSPFVQGPGIANALKSVKLAQGQGILNDMHKWRPGTNPSVGIPTDQNANLMYPGESYEDTGMLENLQMTDSVEYKITAEHMSQVGSTTLNIDSGTAEYNPLFVVKSDGVYRLTKQSEGNYTISDEPVAELDAPNADLFRFGAHTPYENLGATSLVEYYDWTDVNGDGAYNGTGERNRIIYNWAANAANDQTTDYCSIHEPMNRVNDGMVIQIRNYGGASFNFDLTINQYDQVEWDWIEVGNSEGTIPGGSIGDYNLTATVPADAPKGFYGGKIMIHDVTNDQMHTIPVTINVAESFSGDDAKYLDMKFGANDGNQTYNTGIYRNDQVLGSWTGDPPRDGDWRYYYFNLKNDTGSPVAINLNYSNAHSDVEAYLLGPDSGGTGFGVFSYAWPMRYGGDTLGSYGKTENAAGSIGMVTPESLGAGMYAVAVHSHELSGEAAYQEFSGQVYTVGETLTPDYTGEFVIDSEQDYMEHSTGTLPYVIHPGFSTDSPSFNKKPPSLSDTEIWTGELGPGNAGWGKKYFVKYATHKKMTLIDVKTLTIDILTAEAGDIDMALMKDADGNGKLTMADQQVATSGTSGSMEHIEYTPADGVYWIAVNPYAAQAGQTFTAEIVKTYAAGGVEWNVNDLPETLTAGQSVEFNITYSLPAKQGAYSSWMSLGREDYGLALKFTPSVTLLDGMPGELNLNEKQSTMSIRQASDNIVFDYSDPVFYSGLNYGTAEVYVNDMAVPDDAVAFDKINEQIIFTGAYELLEDGVYDLMVECEDGGGNLIESSPIQFQVARDIGVELSLNPIPERTNSQIIDISGTVTPGAEVKAIATGSGDEYDIIVNDDGTFNAQVLLPEGREVIKVVAENDYGYTEVVRRTIITDVTYPSISVDSYPEEVHSDSVAISGSVSESSTVYVGGQVANIDAYSYQANVELVEGQNEIMILAEDSVGNINEETIEITYTPNYATEEDINDMSDELSSEISTVEGNLTDQMSNMESDINDQMGVLERKLTNVQDTASQNRRKLADIDDQVGDTKTQLGNVRSSIESVQNKNDNIKSSVQDNSNQLDDVKDQMSQMTTINAAVIIIMLIALAIVYMMLSRKIGAAGTATPVEEEEMYEEEEMFEEPEEEEEMFEEEEFGEEDTEVFEEEEIEEEPEDIFEEEEEFSEEEEEF